MPATVDALLPLSFLEAVRDVDAPDGDLDADFVSELRNKRLGLSDTVYLQIRRFNDLVKRKQRSSFDETVAIATLLGRRPDAEAVFRAAGRFLAREAYLTLSPVARRMMLILPSFVARPMALRRARRLVGRYLNGTLERRGSTLLFSVNESVTASSAPRGAGCSYYEATLRELMRLLIGATGSIEHVRCTNRNEGHCEWRAEWRGADRPAADRPPAAGAAAK